MPRLKRILRVGGSLVFWPVLLLLSYAFGRAVWHLPPAAPGSAQRVELRGGVIELGEYVDHGPKLSVAFELELAILLFGSETRRLGATEVALVPARGVWATDPHWREGAWTPNWRQVEQLEDRLRGEIRRKLAETNSDYRRSDLRHMLATFTQRPRQYAGYTIAGRRVLSANAFFPRAEHPREWLLGVLSVCDGGPDFWQAWWFIETDEIQIEANPRA